MDFFDGTITLMVFLPFTLLGLYYFCVIIYRTVTGPEEISGWKGHLYFLGLVLAQIGGMALLWFAIYLILYAGFAA